MVVCCRLVVAQWSERRQLRSEAFPVDAQASFLSVCSQADLPPAVNQYSNHELVTARYVNIWVLLITTK